MTVYYIYYTHIKIRYILHTKYKCYYISSYIKEYFMTPIIICATLSQNINTCKILLENGFDPNSLGEGEELVSICTNPTLSLYITKERNCTALICAAILGNLDLCNLLIKHGADVNAKTDNGFTPLIYAAMINNYEMCKLLLDNGADIKATTKHGYSALSYAALNGNTKICEVLLKPHTTHHTTALSCTKNQKISEVKSEPSSCRDYVLSVLYKSGEMPLSVKDVHNSLPNEAKSKYSVQNVSTTMFHLKREGKVEGISNGRAYVWRLLHNTYI